jgi:acyl dehydratase/putative sterol carrier protein
MTTYPAAPNLGAETLSWEDYELGAAVTSAPRLITAEDLASFTRVSGDDNPLHTEGDSELFDKPVLHGPFGIALFLGALRSTGWDQGILALMDTRWDYRLPIHVGDTISCEITITRKRLSKTPGRGILHRDVRLVNQDGEVVQTGTSAALAATRGHEDLPAALQFGTPAWGEALVPALEDEPGFTAAVATYDGSIGLAAGDQEVHFRIYRGKIIEASRRSLRGADFVLSAEENTWTEMLLGPENDFMKRAMPGQFSVRGNGAEYLRMTKVLALMVDAARRIAKKETEK